MMTHDQIQTVLNALQNSQLFVQASSNINVLEGFGQQLDDADEAIALLRAFLAEPSEADDTSCPTCGEDGGTSCGMPNCGLLIGESDVEPQNEPVAWQLGHRFYTSLKDAEYAWRNDCAFLGTSYVPEPLFTHPASKPTTLPELDALDIAVIGKEHFGNPIPKEWYTAARAILAAAREKAK